MIPCENCGSDLFIHGKRTSGGIRCTIKNCGHVNKTPKQRTHGGDINERWSDLQSISKDRLKERV